MESNLDDPQQITQEDVEQQLFKMLRAPNIDAMARVEAAKLLLILLKSDSPDPDGGPGLKKALDKLLSGTLSGGASGFASGLVTGIGSGLSSSRLVLNFDDGRSFAVSGTFTANQFQVLTPDQKLKYMGSAESD